MRRTFLLGLIFAVAAAGCSGTPSFVAPPAQPVVLESFSSIYSFKGGWDGSHPQAGLAVANGQLYGTTYWGGVMNAGTIFHVTPAGLENVLHHFQIGHNATDGAHPHADLLVHDNLLYGTTMYGGQTTNVLCGLSGCGILFHYDLRGVTLPYDNLVSMDPGFHSQGRLLAAGGFLYGTTRDGGLDESISFFCKLACGSVFKVRPNGKDLELVRGFLGPEATPKDGSLPVAGVTLYNGDLYGTTLEGGLAHNGTSANHGTIFKIAKERYSVAYNFDGAPDAARPAGPLLARGAELIGTTYAGGTSGCGTVFALDLSVRRPKERILHQFTCYPGDGKNPEAGVIDVDGVLYGTTYRGGTHDLGIVFKVGVDGSGYQVLHSFNRSDGAHPLSGLVRLGNALYGTTDWGGSANAGTVFKVAL